MTIDYQLCQWHSHSEGITQVRIRVFVEEQHVPIELEIDEHDPHCQHVIALAQDKVVATARLLDDGHIGRMCVLAEYRQQGIASTLMNMLLESAKQRSFKRIKLHAQVSAIPFYEKFGFTVCSAVFYDAGIEHKTMQLNLMA